MTVIISDKEVINLEDLPKLAPEKIGLKVNINHLSAILAGINLPDLVITGRGDPSHHPDEDHDLEVERGIYEIEN